MQRHRRVWAFALVLGLALLVPLTAVRVTGHEHVTAGEYGLIIGWRAEPAVAGVLNGLDLGIERHLLNGSTEMVVGVEGDLNATLSTGPASGLMALEPQFGRPGWYTFDVIPTRAGVYSLHLTGMLGTTAVDVRVDLDDVRPASDVAFPIPDPTPSELQARLDAANAALANLQTWLAVAIVAALAGIGVSLASLVRIRRFARDSRKAP